jgi:Short C-terminal domain
MNSNEDLMRAVKEIGQEFGKIADQAGSFVREAAHQVAGKMPGIGKDGAMLGDPIDGIRRLGELRDAGLLTEDEFQAKKQQLLDRI